MLKDMIYTGGIRKHDEPVSKPGEVKKYRLTPEELEKYKHIGPVINRANGKVVRKATYIKRWDEMY